MIKIQAYYRIDNEVIKRNTGMKDFILKEMLLGFAKEMQKADVLKLEERQVREGYIPETEYSMRGFIISESKFKKMVGLVNELELCGSTSLRYISIVDGLKKLIKGD